MDKQDTKNLKKRYSLWLYKTTKETLDKIERKFTQLEIDRFILKELNQLDKSKKAPEFITDFATHVQNKEKEALSLKYENKELKPDYYFLVLKLRAIEKSIVKELGKSTLSKIKNLYEEEMLKIIMEERQEKR